MANIRRVRLAIRKVAGTPSAKVRVLEFIKTIHNYRGDSKDSHITDWSLEHKRGRWYYRDIQLSCKLCFLLIENNN